MGKGMTNIFTQWHENVSGKCVPPLTFYVNTETSTPTMRTAPAGRPRGGPLHLRNPDDLGPWRHRARALVRLRGARQVVLGPECGLHRTLGGRAQGHFAQHAGATLFPGADVYLKQGYYRTESQATSVIYHDGMRRGSSYAAVDPERP